ncbi:MAG: YdcF family protein [Clostridiales bacterium]|nr:YdcF family protein [Clostridiales bacterium]
MEEYRNFLKNMGDYIFAEDEPEKADIIFVPGNGYPQMAERAARLYGEGYAPCILPSGRFSVTVGCFSGVLAQAEEYPGNFETEWEFLHCVLRRNGVPEQAILKEDQATFTYENASYSRQITDQAGIRVRNAILCCKNYHAGRARMYYQLLYPEARILVCPSAVDEIRKENWTQTEEGIAAVMGEAKRIVTQFSLWMGKA